MRLRALLLPILAAVLAVPSTAGAAGGSISYLGADGNVWLTSPDGARKKQVTANAGGSLSYYSPSQADDGTVVVAANNKWFYVLGPDGSNRSGPWLARINGLSGSPTSAQVTPGGSTIAYGYLYQAQPDTGQWNLQPRVHFNSTSAPGSSCGAPFICHTGYSDPRWIHGTPYAGMLNPNRDQIVVQGGSGVRPWLSANGETFDSFDYSRTGNQALLTTDIGSGRRRLYLWQNNGPAPEPGSVVCQLDGFGNGDSAPRFSPDGTAITWHDAQGVWTSPRPVQAGGRCALSPSLVAPGGRSPDWGAAALAGEPSEEEPPPPPPPADDSTPPSRTPSTPSTPQALATQQAKALAKTGIGKLLRRGSFPASYRATKPGTLRVQLLKGRTVLASAGKRVNRAGRVTVQVKLTKAGRRALARSKRVRAKLSVTFVPRKGKRSTSSRALTLKR